MPRRPLQKALVFNFELITVPKGTPQALHDALRTGVKDAWGGIFWPKVLFEYESVSNYGKWSDPPDFFYKITESKNKMHFSVYVKRNKGGDHFVWSDFGTGIAGKKKKPYIIVPKAHARTGRKYGVSFTYFVPPSQTLKFVVPYQPRTAPLGGVTYDTGRAQEMLFRRKVIHPGIRPRHFSQRVILRTVYDVTLPGGFKDATEKGWMMGFNKARQSGLIP